MGKAVAVGNICSLPFHPSMSFLHLTSFNFILIVSIFGNGLFPLRFSRRVYG